MNFYTVSYVESQITSGHTVGFVIFVVILLALLGVGIQVLRNGFTSRYRDLTVILSFLAPTHFFSTGILIFSVFVLVMV